MKTFHNVGLSITKLPVLIPPRKSGRSSVAEVYTVGDCSVPESSLVKVIASVKI